MNSLARRLSQFVDLDAGDRAALDQICENVRRVPRHADVISEGDTPDHTHLVLEGWAARYKIVPSGARQITAFLIPGDFCDRHVGVLAEMDHSIGAITPLKVADMPHDRIEAIGRAHPRLARAFWWSTLVDEAILRSWIVSLGRRSARERIAHLMCELHLRMANVGLVNQGQFRMPLTQEQLGDAMGLTSVHVNRMLRSLRSEGLITWISGDLVIQDIDRLRHVAGFDPNYLHLRPKDEELRLTLAS